VREGLIGRKRPHKKKKKKKKKRKVVLFRKEAWELLRHEEGPGEGCPKDLEREEGLARREISIALRAAEERIRERPLSTQ